MLAILVLLVLTIGATAIAGLVASNEKSSGRERSAASALSSAEGGLDLAANLVNTDFTAGTLSPGTTHTTGIDQYGYAVTYWYTAVTDGSYPSGSYYLNAKSVSPSGQVTRVVQEVIQPKTINQFTTTPSTVSTSSTSTSASTSTLYTTTSTPPQPFWSYGFVMGGSPHTGNLTPDQVCVSPSVSLPTTAFGGSGAISVPVWIAGDVCITGGANPAIGNPSGSTIPVHIGGSLYVNGPNYAIGTPTSPISDADITACFTDFHGWFNLACNSNTQNANNGGSGVYASAFTAGSTAVSPPSISASDESTAWSTATFGPKHTSCSTSGSLPSGLFDNNAGSTSGPDTSLGLKNLATILGTTKFDCVSGSYELKWDPTKSPKELTLYGTAFFDADLTMAGADYIKLMPGSNGTIYVDGYLKLTNDGSICAYYSGTTCSPGSDAWNPGTNPSDPVVEWYVFNRPNAQYGFDLEGNSNLEGIALTNGGFYLSNSAEFAGSVYAMYGTVNGAGTFLTTGQIPIGGFGGSGTSTIPIGTSTYLSTTTVSGGATVTTVTESAYTASWNVAPGSWKQCPVSGCPSGT